MVADGSGSFSASVALTPASANVLTITATDAAGNTGTNGVTITHDPVVVFVNLSQSGSYVTSGANFILSGTTKPNISVDVTGGALTLTGTSDGSGAFAFTVPLSANAVNMLQLTATDATLTQATGSVTVTQDSINPTLTFLAIPTFVNSANLTVTGSTEANATLSITNLSGSTFTGSSDMAGNFTVTLPLVVNSLNTFTFTATDAAGNIGTGSVSTTQDGNAPTQSAVTVTSSVLGATATASYTFTTNETATGTLYIGTGSNVAVTLVSTNSTFGLSHTGTVLGLAQNTVYYAYSTALDQAGNLSQTPVISFTTAVTAPVVTPVISGGSGGGGGGGGGSVGGGGYMDSCPSGDYSRSYYDGSCGTKPVATTSSGTTSVTTPSKTSTGTVSTKPVTSNPSKVPGKVETVVTPSLETDTEEVFEEEEIPEAPTTQLPNTSLNPQSTPVSGAIDSPGRKNDASAIMVDVSAIEGFVAAKHIHVDNTAIIRTAPNFASKTVTYLPRNYPVTVVAYGKNWSKIRFDNGVVGYIRSVFLRDQSVRDQNRTDPYLFVRTLTKDRLVDRRSIKVKHSIFVRKNPDLNAKIQTWIYSGDVAFILDQVGEWSEIRTKSGIGFVKTKFLQK